MSQPAQRRSLWIRKVHSPISAAVTIGALLAALLTAPAQAQTFTLLTQLSKNIGADPSRLIQGLDGNLYGAMASNGIFKITPSGKLTTLDDGCCDEYYGPTAPLNLAIDGNFYGTTLGTVFTVTPEGALTTLYTFSCNSCDSPATPSELVQATDGKFYGTTEWIGGWGSVFSLTRGGTLTTLHNFDRTDGGYPLAGLVQANDGHLYGATSSFGPNGGGGTIFRINRDGTQTTIHSFRSCCAFNGPNGALIQATDGNLYGANLRVGTHYAGEVFRITLGGVFTALHEFCGQTSCPDGSGPAAPLVEATDGNFYGTTLLGGNSTGCLTGCGTIFRITRDGTFTTLYSFCATTGCPDGTNPNGLVEGTNGKLYGTTQQAGSSSCPYGCGTIFSLDLGLAPFVKTLPVYGIVGQTVRILGNNLTGSTAVSFHGYPAKFTVVSDTEIDAAVPAGAITGTVHVTTPATKLASYPVFHVMPQIKSISPTGGPVETLITITGLSLTPVKKVEFNGVQATFGVVNDTSISVYVPVGATTGPIEVFSPGGAATSTSSFTVTP